jgi:hypothetical protein
MKRQRTLSEVCLNHMFQLVASQIRDELLTFEMIVSEDHFASVFEFH